MRKVNAIVVIAVIALTGLPPPAGAYPGKRDFFTNLTSAEAAMLDRGEPVIRAVKSVREFGLLPFDDRAVALRSRFEKLKPNYITELLLSIPVKNKEQAAATLSDLALALADVYGYVKIPYWSVRQKTMYDLFDMMEVLKRTRQEGGESIEVRQHMEPFATFRARYEYRQYPDVLLFSGVNLEPIVYSYKNLKAVASGGMLWELYVFMGEGRLYAYGAGGVNAFDLFGLVRDRLEPSFMGRVDAFFRHISNKMNR